MNESKHTPGPWAICEDKPWGDDKGGFRIDAENTEQLAYVWNETARYGGGPFGAKEGKANARLIAAAPDLLAACEALEGFDAHAQECAECDEWGANNCREGLDLMTKVYQLNRAAIAKARAE